MTDLSLLLSTSLLIAIALIPVLAVGLMFLHAARTPAWVWAFTSHTQAVWVALLLGGILIVPAGLCLAGWYFFKIRPRLAAIERGEMP